MTDREREPDPADASIMREQAIASGKHNEEPEVVEHVGEASVGTVGAIVGASVGWLGGPVGSVIGGIAGAMTGWWVGEKAAEAASTLTKLDDDYYRRHYESFPNRLADRSYDAVKPAYYLGHVASRNPDYRSRTFDEIEPELRNGWTSNPRQGSWDAVRSYASEGYKRGLATRGDKESADDVQDRVAKTPPSRPGPDDTNKPERRF